MLLQWEQSGATDLLLLNEPEEGGYEGNFLDPHLDALRGIVKATDDQKGRIPACWNNHTGPAGSSVILFAPDPNDQPSILGRMEYPGDYAEPVVILAWLRKPAAKFCKT